MKKQSIEFYIGSSVWLFDILTACGMWVMDKSLEVTLPVSWFSIIIVASLYGVFFLGHLISHGVVSFSSNKNEKIAGLVLSSLSILGLTICFFFPMVALLATVVITQLAFYMKEKQALLIAVLVPCAGLLVDVLLGKGFGYPVIFIYGTFNVLAVVANYRLIAARKAKHEAEQLVHELKATQILLSSTTKRDERLRIARDLHDALGHQLTALNLQLEVVNHAKEENKQQHLQQAKAISHSLLSDVRETVSEIRLKKDVKLCEALKELTKGLPDLSINLEMNFDDSIADARQAEVIFRCVQEALTNIAKHSNASMCTISLSSNHEYIQLAITDNGQAVTAIQPGNGLTGMKERVMEINGAMSYQVSEDGVKLTIKLPNYI